MTANADSLTPVTRSNDGAGNGDKADVSSKEALRLAFGFVLIGGLLI